MPRNKKRKSFKNYPECGLCSIGSTGLKVNGFCKCICEPTDYEFIERLLNGTIVKHQIIKKSLIPFLKEKYDQKLIEAGVENKSTLKKIASVAKSKKEKVSRDKKTKFYDSWEWRELRYKALKEYGARCQNCGATNKTDKICVDHIKPLSLFWDMRLDFNNLQILCDSCNMGKSNKDCTDFRKSP